MAVAALVIDAVRLWLIAGAAVAAIFLTIGMDRIDEDAQGAYVFRPLLIPGVLLIWPLVLWRWFLYETKRENWQSRYRPPRNAHQLVSWTLCLSICLIIVAGLSARQQWPADIEPVQISPAPEASQ